MQVHIAPRESFTEFTTLWVNYGYIAVRNFFTCRRVRVKMRNECSKTVGSDDSEVFSLILIKLFRECN